MSPEAFIAPAPLRPTANGGIGRAEYSGGSSPSGWSRRSFLDVLSAVAVGTVTGSHLDGADPQAIDPRAGSGLGRTGTGGGAATGDGGYTTQPPYTLTDQCELSEDYFLVQNHQIDPAKDTVVAYSRTDGEVEAVVLQDEVVRQICRDPSQPGGWNVNALPDANNVTTMVAGISGPVDLGANNRSAATLKIFYLTSNAPDTLFIATENPSAEGESSPTFTTTSIPWISAVFGLQIAVNFDNSLMVSAIQYSTSQTTLDGRLYFYADGLTNNHTPGQPLTPAYGYLTGFAYSSWVSPFSYVGGADSGWSALVGTPSGRPTVFLCLPSGSYGPVAFGPLSITLPAVNIWSWQLGPGEARGTVAHWWAGDVAEAPAAPTNPRNYCIEYATVLGSSNTPALLIRTLETDYAQRLWMLSPDDTDRAWAWTPLGLPAGLDKSTPVVLSTAIRPRPSTEKSNNTGKEAGGFLDIFLVTNNVLSVLRQAPQNDALEDYINPAYCPVIPLQTDVSVMTSQAGQSTGNELILVGTDGSLQTLLKDPVSGHWADTPLHLPASELQQVSAYRVELDLLDGWNAPVAGQPLQVSASTPATALINGQTVRLTQTPTTITTDGQGQAVLALIADGLSAPTLTVTAASLSVSATVSPSGPINTYMQGKTSLNYQSPLTADTLTNAQTPDGRPVVPGASDPNAAATAVNNMSTAASWAAGPSGVSARRSSIVARRDGTLGARTGVGKPATVKSILLDIDHWAHDALHAIKKGAAKVENIAYDAESKTFTLAADFADWAGQAVTIVIHGIEDAAHVIHAVLNKLVGAIIDAVKWLEAEVIGLLKDTAAVAAQYDTWLGQCSSFLASQIRQDTSVVDTWLATRQAKIEADFAALTARFTPSTTLSNMATNPPQGTNTTRSRRPAPTRARAALGDSSTADGSPHSNWLLNKVKNEITGQLALPVIGGLEGLVTDLGTAAEAAVGDFKAAFNDFWAFLKTSIEHPSQIGTLGVRDLLQAVAKLIDGVFTLARGIIAALAKIFPALADAIPTILATPLSSLPIVGKLLALIGLGSVKIGTLINLLFAFPATLAYKISHGGKGRPFAGTTVDRSVGHAKPRPTDQLVGDVAADLKIAGGAALGVWATFDTLSAAFLAIERKSGPMLFAAVDIAAPIIVTFLTVPSTQDGEPYFSPPVSGSNSDEMNFISWLLGTEPALTAACILYIDTYLKNEEGAPAWKGSLLWLTGMCGILAMVTGLIGTEESTDPSGADYAIAVLNNMALIVAPPPRGRVRREHRFCVRGHRHGHHRVLRHRRGRGVRQQLSTIVSTSPPGSHERVLMITSPDPPGRLRLLD